MKHAPYQSGNILFLILIAVALFAALSYAVTQSSKTGGSSISKDKAKLAASQIIQYATTVQQTVTRLMLINQCSDTQLSFERSPFDGSDTAYVNPNAPANKKCHVFHPDGGGITEGRPSDNMLDESLEGVGMFYGEYVVIGLAHMSEIGSDCTDAACAELSIFLPNAREEICLEINKRFNIAAPVPTNGVTNFHGAIGVPFKGSYSYTNAGSVISNPALAGKETACLNRNNPIYGKHGFYHVLIAR